MSIDQSVSTVVLVESDEVSGSLGRPGYLEAHLRRIGDPSHAVDVLRVPGGRCDVIDQRLASGGLPMQINIPSGLESWYSAAITPIDVPATAVLFVMSVADTVVGDVWRHRAENVLVQLPPDSEEVWTEDQKAWLHEFFEPAPPTDDQMPIALESIVRRLASVGCELVLFNVSTVIPDEKVYWFRPDDPETTSVRAARANLVVDRLANQPGLVLVDVDRVTAELGAGTAVVGTASYSEETLHALAEEAMGVILDLEGISQLFASDAMQLIVPRYDRRTTKATLTKWHVTGGVDVEKGDVLFDLRFSDLRASLKNDRRTTNKALKMSVVAGRSGYVDRISAEVGATVTVGTRVGVVTSTREAVWDDLDSAARFPVGIRLEARDDQ